MTGVVPPENAKKEEAREKLRVATTFSREHKTTGTGEEKNLAIYWDLGSRKKRREEKSAHRGEEGWGGQLSAGKGGGRKPV